MRPTPLSIAGALVAAAGASAQPLPVTSDCTITWSLGWTEGPGGNNDGRLEPGESAVIHLSVSFTNQNGIANFSPPIGTFGSGTIRGLGGGWLDLHGTGGAQGSWNADPNSGYGVAELWCISDLFPLIGNGGADLIDIQVGQFPPNPNRIMTANPVVDIFTGLWTPTDYTPRTVTWRVAGDPAFGVFVSSVCLQLNSVIAAQVFVEAESIMYGSVEIPIGVPAPSVLTIALASFAAPRRRKRRPRLSL